MVFIRDLRQCLGRVGWIKTGVFILTLVGVYAAALATFLGLATGIFPRTIFRQPLPRPDSPSSDLTNSPDYMGTVQLSAVELNTFSNELTFVLIFKPAKMMVDSGGSLIPHAKFLIQGQSILYESENYDYDIPRRLSALQTSGSFVLYVPVATPSSCHVLPSVNICDTLRMYPFDFYTTSCSVECYHKPQNETEWRGCNATAFAL
jgi:hypothetical protein